MSTLPSSDARALSGSPGPWSDGAPLLPAWEPPASVAKGPPGSIEDSVRLSLRIVIQLGRIGPPGDNGDARSESTQQGLAQALSVTQGAVSKVLSRLVAAEVVEHERQHVRGLDRRVRVYFLTRKGEGLAREIQDRFGLAPRAADAR